MIKLVAKEITQLQVSLPEGIRLQVNEENLSQINAFILGPGDFQMTSIMQITS